MQHCTHCNVEILETRTTCPLCGNKLPAPKEKESVVSFPQIPSYLKSHMTLRILLFVSIVMVVLSFTIYFIFPTELNWPLLLLLGLLSIWLDMIFLVQKRFHIPKKIVWQVAIISLLSVFWDWNTGWRGWSLNYVIPLLCITALLLMYSIAVIMKLGNRDYITYAFMSALFGFIPILFLLFDWVTVEYPSIISIAVSFIFLSAIFILQGNSIKTEIEKRFHI